uniref:Uncharacterized protein n=3 Tax=Candidatus Kentrum sp. FM TaxID=2126340 RepID=A0A450THJ5_9GAMM|nr:MAG: hypothetical protein BECKFM1743A_GA0114220_104233 [Candidatus Kentron sp. FM]VFK07693.1 MAG: hypothetical protein BECKFM1743B_GA0114221_1004813 [Candidatus Kentron sp. FM]
MSILSEFLTMLGVQDDFCIQLNLLVFIVQLVRCTAVTWLMRLPRALNLNGNPAQFGIFLSANRLR